MAARKTAEKVFRSNIQGGGDSPPDDIQPLGNVIEAPPTSSGEGILHLAPTRLIPPNPAQSGSVNNPVPAPRLSKTIRFQTRLSPAQSIIRYPLRGSVKQFDYKPGSVRLSRKSGTRFAAQ